MVTLGEPVRITYRNYRGETAQRVITPQRVWFGSTEWHPEPQWPMAAFDHEKQANRDFAIKDFGYPAPSTRTQALEEKPVAYLRQKDIDRLSSCHPGAINVQISNTPFMGFLVPVFSALSSHPVADGCKALQPDWAHIAKMAGKFGIRYQTNQGFVDFLKVIHHLPQAPGASE